MVGWLAERYFFALSQKHGSNQSRLKVWYLFINFIYKSCLKDAKMAGKVSLDTNAYHQELVSGLLYVKSQWTSFQFTTNLKQLQPGGREPEERASMAKKAEEKLLTLKENTKRLRTRCVSQDRLSVDLVQEEFDTPLKQCFDQWEILIKTLLRLHRGIYEPVREKGRSYAIVRIRYGNRGTWRICPNGHISTTVDLRGGAVTSICNECSGDTIEGIRHKDTINVEQAMDLEEDEDDEDEDMDTVGSVAAYLRPRLRLLPVIDVQNEIGDWRLRYNGVRRQL